MGKAARAKAERRASLTSAKNIAPQETPDSAVFIKTRAAGKNETAEHSELLTREDGSTVLAVTKEIEQLWPRNVSDLELATEVRTLARRMNDDKARKDLAMAEFARRLEVAGLREATIGTWKLGYKPGACLDQKKLKADQPELVAQYQKRYEYLDLW